MSAGVGPCREGRQRQAGRPLRVAVAVWQGEGRGAVCQQGFLLISLFAFGFSLQPRFFLCSLSFSLRTQQEQLPPILPMDLVSHTSWVLLQQYVHTLRPTVLRTH